MKSISIRDLRQRWPAVEALLQIEMELVITRDARPIAKLIRIDAVAGKRTRFDPVAHGKWQRKTSGGKVSGWVERALTGSRQECRPS